MAYSSFHIQEVKPNQKPFEHNDRTHTAPYVFSEKTYLNEFDKTAIQAQAYFEFLINEAITNYRNRTGQKIQTKRHKWLQSAVVNLNSNHTLKDLQKLADKLCEHYGWQIVQIAVHRDEGHIDNDGIFVPNLHGHMEFFMLGKDGIFNKKTNDFGRRKMSEIQTEVAEILGMQRGNRDYESRMQAKRLGLVPMPMRKRLGHNEYRWVSQEKQRLELEEKKKQKELAKKQQEANLEFIKKIKAIPKMQVNFEILNKLLFEFVQKNRLNIQALQEFLALQNEYIKVGTENDLLMFCEILSNIDIRETFAKMRENLNYKGAVPNKNTDAKTLNKLKQNLYLLDNKMQNRFTLKLIHEIIQKAYEPIQSDFDGKIKTLKFSLEKMKKEKYLYAIYYTGNTGYDGGYESKMDIITQNEFLENVDKYTQMPRTYSKIDEKLLGDYWYFKIENLDLQDILSLYENERDFRKRFKDNRTEKQKEYQLAELNITKETPKERQNIKTSNIVQEFFTSYSYDDTDDEYVSSGLKP